MSDVVHLPHNKRRIVGLMLLVVVASGVLVAWWWPRVAGRADHLNLLVMGTGQFAQSHDVIDRRMRELGLTIQWLDGVDSWCDAAAKVPAALTELQPRRVVASFINEGDCADGVGSFVHAIGETALVAQIQPGLQSSELAEKLFSLRPGTKVVDPTRLLPATGTDSPCMWWDDCGPNGTVTVRELDGTLTVAGGQRIARSLAAILP